jgi:hydroxyacylglutathione hydrolase
VLFERIEDKGLAHYSYAIGCEGAGIMAVVDPRRDVDVYLELAAAHHLRIAYVLETHIHADFASGARELGARTGATLALSAYDAGELYTVQFPHDRLRDGDRLELGRVLIEARHTPGHTPEHLSFLVTDTARTAAVPQLLLSGDFLFVGSVGRPDLLGSEATMTLARQMYESVRKLRDLPDGLEIHPAHGAGSMCGAGMSARPMSTLGFERIANPMLAPGLTDEQFIDRLLSTLPPLPAYYRRMKQLNAAGPPFLDGGPAVPPIDPHRFAGLASSGHLVIDLRDQMAYGAGHVPGAFAIGAGTSLSTWAAWVVPYDRPLLLVAEDERRVDEAVRALVRVGLDEVKGVLAGGMPAWKQAGFETKRTPQHAPADFAALLAREPGIRVVDVRSDEEWRLGHVCGATHVMAGDLPERAADLARGPAPLAVICGTGYRSTVAASVLERAGAQQVMNVTGGMAAWKLAGLPTCGD